MLKNFLDNIEENIEIINTIGINLFNAKKYEELEKHLINLLINMKAIFYFFKWLFAY